MRVLESEVFALNDVVMVRVYLVDMKHVEDFDKAFIEYFHEIRPSCTLVGIKELVKPDLLIEIECIVERS